MVEEVSSTRRIHKALLEVFNDRQEEFTVTEIWDNMILKPYLEEQAPESDPDEQRREDQIDEMIKNTENFKQVCKMNW